jgi:hypothetical protein
MKMQIPLKTSQVKIMLPQITYSWWYAALRSIHLFHFFGLKINLQFTTPTHFLWVFYVFLKSFCLSWPKALRER